MTQLETVVRECKQLQKEGRFADALDVATHAIDATLEPELFYLRGGILEELGDYPRALADYSKAIGAAPKTLEYYLARGLLFSSRLEDGSAAITDYKAAIVLDPKSLAARQELCLCYLREGDYKNALIHAEKAVELGPTDYFSFSCLGQCYLYTGRYHAAIKELQTATSLDRTDVASWSALGRAFKGVNDYEKAVECYSNALTLEPTAIAWISLASAQLELGKTEVAKESLKAASSFDLNEAEALLVNGYLTIAKRSRGRPSRDHSAFLNGYAPKDEGLYDEML